MQLMRSILITPATGERILQRAAATSADWVVLDLEDSVAHSDKEAARQRAVTAINELDWQAQGVACRVNALDSSWGVRDLIALLENCAHRLDAVLVPKARTNDVAFIRTMARGVWPAGVRPLPAVHVLIEDAAAYAQLNEICGAPGLSAVYFGSGDFTASIGVASVLLPRANRATPRDAGGDYTSVRSHLAVMAKAFGLFAIDTPVADFHDLDAFAAEARWARSAGFDGKMCIHPAQVPVCNETFRPTQAEFDAAREVVAAFESGGAAVFTLRDVMVDEATLRIARQVYESGIAAGLG
jgi:citrate lyase beta subunit